MPTYQIQKRIHTLLEYAIWEETTLSPFTLDGIQFQSWNVESPWRCQYWVTQAMVESANFAEAFKDFQKALAAIVSRIAFIGQAYHTDIGEPYLIHKTNADIAYFRHSRDRSPVPLSFGTNDLRSLITLDQARDVQAAFYSYWNDATNAVGYTAKLVLMFAALEVLFKKASRPDEEFYADIGTVFGPELKKQLYGTKQNSRQGLRQRLVHGDHLSEHDTTNYVQLIHQHIVGYFNGGILRNTPMNEHIVNPQRHPFGNWESWQGFVRPIGGARLDLKAVQEAFDSDDSAPPGYAIVAPEDRPETY